MLTDAEVEVAAAVGAVSVVTGAGHERHRRRCEVGRAAEEPRHAGADPLDHLAARHTAREPLGIGGEAGNLLIPAGWKPIGEEVAEFGRQGRIGLCEIRHDLLPSVVALRAADTERTCKMRRHLGWHAERLVDGPAIRLLGPLDLLGTEGRAVRLVRARLLGRPVADHALHDHERGLPLLTLEGFECFPQRGRVVGIGDPLDPPPETLESPTHVLGKGEMRLALDRDRVVVIDPAEIRQAEMPGDRRCLRRHPLHEIAVATEHVGVVVEDDVAGPVVVGSQPLRGHRHADGVAAALAERAGGRFDAGGHVMLGMAGADAVELAKLLDLVERHGGSAVRATDPREVDQRIEKHRRVPAGEHEAVTIGPLGIGRVVTEEVLPNGERHGCQRHRRAGVAALRRLDGVHRKRTDRVDCEAVEVGGVRGAGCGGGHKGSFGALDRRGECRSGGKQQSNAARPGGTSPPGIATA